MGHPIMHKNKNNNNKNNNSSSSSCSIRNIMLIVVVFIVQVIVGATAFLSVKRLGSGSSKDVLLNLSSSSSKKSSSSKSYDSHVTLTTKEETNVDLTTTTTKTTAAEAGQQQQQQQDHRFLEESNHEKFRQRGDSHDCMTVGWVGSKLPCYSVDMIGGGGPSFFFSNKLVFDLYVGLPPNTRSISPMVAFFMTNFFNSTTTLETVDIFFYTGFEDAVVRGISGEAQQIIRNHVQTVSERFQEKGGMQMFDDDGDDDTTTMSPTTGPSAFSSSGGGRVRRLLRNNNERAANSPFHSKRGAVVARALQEEQPPLLLLFDLYYIRTAAELVDRFDENDLWLWRYGIEFEVFWRETGVPVLELDFTKLITVNMTLIAQEMQLDIRNALAEITGIDPMYLGFSSEKDVLPKDWRSSNMTTTRDDHDVEFDDGVFDDDREFGDLVGRWPSPAPSPPEVVVEDPAGSETILDAGTNQWDWQRYIGVGLIAFSISATAVLVTWSARRKHQRYQREAWLNLHREEGVEKLLATGWVVTAEGGSCPIAVFDKSTWGYSDANSMFVGGFERSEQIITIHQAAAGGADISFSTAQESATAETTTGAAAP